jgi:hypothetical protein
MFFEQEEIIIAALSGLSGLVVQEATRIRQ